MPRRLESSYTLSVSFQPKIIKEALADWVERYPSQRLTQSGPHFYKPQVYERLGL
jgi:hypothetical protein